MGWPASASRGSKMIPDKPEAMDRFLRHVILHTNGCWVWKGSKDKDGYGRHRPIPNRSYIRAHRFSWMLYRGDIPEYIHVLHGCDNPPCVNPDHLFLGTNRINIDDMVSKHRQRVGKAIEYAKLNDQQVREIRSYPSGFLSNASLGRMYGVGKNAIRKVRNGETWKHIPLEPPKENLL